MAYVLDPICISSEGQIAPTGLQDFALSTYGIVCLAPAVGGGDPEGAWGGARRQFERIRRARQLERAREQQDVSREKRLVEEELDDLDEVITELERELALIRDQQGPILSIDIAALQEAMREKQAFQRMRDEEIRRDNLIYLNAVREQRRAEEMARVIQIARDLRKRLNEELAVAAAIAALLFN